MYIVLGYLIINFDMDLIIFLGKDFIGELFLDVVIIMYFLKDK